MIKKEITKNKSLKMSLALVAIGVLLVLGCPASSNSNGGDTTAPSFDSSSSMPAADATDFPANSNIILTYSEAVQAGTGNITITPSGGAAITIAVTDVQVSIAGAVVTINPTNDLAMSTTYTLAIPAGAFMDAAGNKTAEITLSFSTAAALDTTAPSFDSSSSVPVADATDFPANSNIILTYSEPVQAGTGNITITPSGGAAITIAVGDAQVSIAGAVVTINPTNDLAVSTTYTLTVPAGAFMDAAGNTTAELILSFSTAADLDETAPSFDSSSSMPAADATDFNARLNIVLAYNEPVQAGTGNITITPSGGNAITIAVTDSTQVSIAGAVVTIDPTNSLAVSTTYTLTVPAGAIVDASGNAGSMVTLSFSTAANIVPVVVSSVPASGGITMSVTPSLELTFSEAVQKGSGIITYVGARIRTNIPVGNSNVSISGAVVTIIPTFDLREDTAYTLSFAAGVFVSSTDQTPAPAFSLDFTNLNTRLPTLSSSMPAADATDVAADRDIVLTYNETIQAGSGNITLTPSGGGTPLTIAVTDAQVSISGSVVTIDPTANLERSTEYTLAIPAGGFTDASGNQVAELTLSFTTAGLLAPMLSSSVPAEAGTIASDAGITLTYNQPIVKGSGNILLETSGERDDTITVSSSLVSISGSVVTIDISGFSSGRDSSDSNPYAVALTVPVTAFANADGNNPLSKFTLTFEVSRPAGE